MVPLFLQMVLSFCNWCLHFRDARLCDNCFKVGHFATGCMQKSGCYIEGCNGKHVTVIHPPERSPPASQVTHEIHVMKNTEANPNNQSHARETAEHTIQNHAETSVLVVRKYA